MNDAQLFVSILYFRSENPEMTLGEIEDETGATYAQLERVIDKMVNDGVLKCRYGPDANYYSARDGGRLIAKQLRAALDYIESYNQEPGATSVQDIPF
jgi:DNA-binding MarR family transcriptional regulator